MTESRPVAVITGGTHGIGRHAAETLALDGWSVAVCSRDQDEASAVADKLSARHGAPMLGAAVDVCSPDALHTFAADVSTKFGVPSAVLASAGVLGPVGPLHLVDLSEWARTVEIDLIGVANALAVFGSQMVEHGRGSLITMSGGGIGGPNVAIATSAYTSSKAAVVAMTESVAKELAPYGVRVNAVAPGAIATRFAEPVMAAGPVLAGEELYRQTVHQREHPDSLEDFDAVLRFLVDPSSPFISGRLLSARWDDPTHLLARPPDAASSLYRLRRIDGALFGEIAKDG